MPIDYETVGAFYETLSKNLAAFVARVGEKQAFCGDRNLQISRKEIDFQGCDPVICSITALKAFDAIVSQGEGASTENEDSHYQRFIAIREGIQGAARGQSRLSAGISGGGEPGTAASGACWRARVARKRGDRGYGRSRQLGLHADAAADLALLSTAAPAPGKGYVRRSRPGADARHGATCRTCRASARGAFQSGLQRRHVVHRTARRRAIAARRERGKILSRAVGRTHGGHESTGSEWRCARSRRRSRFSTISSNAPDALSRASSRTLPRSAPLAPVAAPVAAPAASPAPSIPIAAGATGIEPGNFAPTPRTVDGVDYIEGRDLTLIYEDKKCIHSRFCVTWGPKVFIANVKGPWINPDAISTEALTEIAHLCVSGAIRYKRKDGQADEAAPPVNLISVREGGPYAVRADIRLDGAPATSYRYTLCRCGASKRKPFCDGSHHEVNFSATGEPPTGKADMLPVRDGPLAIDPLTDGPLQVRGNVEIISGTGRVVARVESARLCRCGASNTKPFCDGSHARVGFKS
jgi:CDGSH-type Zn-finger protein/uncharacterized Fe-S cluster protein YjdI